MLKKLSLSVLRRWAFPLWLLITGSLAFLLGSAWLGNRFHIDTNILHLLPVDRNNPAVEQAFTMAGDRSSRYWFFLFGAENAVRARDAASHFAKGLEFQSGVQSISGRVDTAAHEQLTRLYWEKRRGLMSRQQAEELATGNDRAVLDMAVAKLYSPFSGVNSALLEKDPFLIFVSYTEELQASQQWQLEQDWPSVRHEGKTYILLTLELADSPFSIDLQEKILPVVDKLLQQSKIDFPDVIRMDLGALRYAADGVRQAKMEIGTIGVGSSLGIACLLLLVFRSAAPLLLSMVPVLCGYLSAVAVCWFVFGSIHLIVLVMGSSLLGLSNDYAMHFFVDREAHALHWQADDTLRRIFTALTLGMVTSVIAFAGLLAAPFPGMQQLALFSATGLLITWLTVMCLFPVVIPRPRAVVNPFIAYSGRFLLFLQGKSVQRILLAGLVSALIMAIYPLYKLESNDDIRLLQSKSVDLLAAEEHWQAVTGMDLSQQFFFVTADNLESVLQHEEELTSFLDQQIKAGHELRYQALSSALPSQQRQRYVRNELIRLATTPDLVVSYREQTGLPETIFRDYAAYLDINDWLDADDLSLLEKVVPAAIPFIIPSVDSHAVGTIVSLDHVEDTHELHDWTKTHPGIYWIDKTSMVSDLFGEYRRNAVFLLVASYIVIALLLIWLYGLKRCFWVMLPPVSAALLTIALISTTGHAINLFHCLGLILVLGAGIDYTLFLEETSEDGAATWLTIILSAFSTILSFGLLALSKTAAVSALGLTVLLGISFSLLLAPLAFQSRKCDIFSNKQFLTDNS